MMRSCSITPGFSVARFVRIFLYTFFILLLQAHLVSRLPYPSLRVDLLLPVMLVAAVDWSPFSGLLWACFWGFLADNLSGEFWGLHVGSYMVTVCLVHIASEKFDCRNPIYQGGIVGLCALGQSIALGLFLSFVPMDLPSLTSTWINLGVRALLSVAVAPFVIYPVMQSRSSF